MNQELTVIFRLAGEEYAIPAACVKGIVCRRKKGRFMIHPFGFAKSMHFGSKKIPVGSLAAKFGLVAKTKKHSCVILIKMGFEEFGLDVDEVTEVRYLPIAVVDIVSGAFPSRASWLKGFGKMGKRLISLLDLTQIFSLKNLPAIEAAEQAYGLEKPFNVLAR